MVVNSGAFRKACGKRAEFIFIDAPHLVPAKKSDEEQASEKVEEAAEERGWWFSAEVR